MGPCGPEQPGPPAGDRGAEPCARRRHGAVQAAFVFALLEHFEAGGANFTTSVSKPLREPADTQKPGTHTLQLPAAGRGRPRVALGRDRNPPKRGVTGGGRLRKPPVTGDAAPAAPGARTRRVPPPPAVSPPPCDLSTRPGVWANCEVSTLRGSLVWSPFGSNTLPDAQRFPMTESIVTTPTERKVFWCGARARARVNESEAESEQCRATPSPGLSPALGGGAGAGLGQRGKRHGWVSGQNRSADPRGESARARTLAGSHSQARTLAGTHAHRRTRPHTQGPRRRERAACGATGASAGRPG